MLGVLFEQTAGLVDVGFVAGAGEDVHQRAIAGMCVADAVGGDDGELEGAGEAECGLIAGFLLTELMALEFDVDIVAAVEGGELFEEGAACGFAATDLTGSTLIGALCGIAAGMALSAVFAVMALGLAVNQVATGLALRDLLATLQG